MCGDSMSKSFTRAYIYFKKTFCYYFFAELVAVEYTSFIGVSIMTLVLIILSNRLKQMQINHLAQSKLFDRLEIELKLRLKNSARLPKRSTIRLRKTSIKNAKSSVQS